MLQRQSLFPLDMYSECNSGHGNSGSNEDPSLGNHGMQVSHSAQPSLILKTRVACCELSSLVHGGVTPYCLAPCCTMRPTPLIRHGSNVTLLLISRQDCAWEVDNDVLNMSTAPY